jgi:hypothetical protein
VIIDTDGTDGFRNATDTVRQGNLGIDTFILGWDGTDNEGNYVGDGVYDIQVMIWDRSRNPVAEPHYAGWAEVITDSDFDNVRDSEDDFPQNPRESSDMDSDGLGDNSDPDRDGDGVDNNDDEFPWNKNEWRDSDSDGIGDNEDPDDNGNNIADIVEIPIVILVLLLPLVLFYYTNKYVSKKKKEKESEKEEDTIDNGT